MDFSTLQFVPEERQGRLPEPEKRWQFLKQLLRPSSESRLITQADDLCIIYDRSVFPHLPPTLRKRVSSGQLRLSDLFQQHRKEWDEATTAMKNARQNALIRKLRPHFGNIQKVQGPLPFMYRRSSAPHYLTLQDPT